VEETVEELHEQEAAPDPFQQFRRWHELARAAALHEPDAVALATATPDGKPSLRMVLLRGFDERGFVFFTNYQSRKGRELAQNPWAALTFWWPELRRQVRVEGWVEKVSTRESDEYFHSRPRGSRLAAWASAQSQLLARREELDRRYAEVAAEYLGREPPRPPFWGGYRVVPTCIEFWQARENRLHDRLRYRRGEDGRWVVERLQP